MDPLKENSARAEDIGTYLGPRAKRDLVNRFSRIEGHVRSLKGMVRDQRCADEILLQIAAVKAALNGVAAFILEHELQACIAGCMEGGVDERMERIVEMVRKLLKQT